MAALTANEILASRPSVVQELFAHICEGKVITADLGCWVTRYASSASTKSGPKKSTTPYPVTSKTIDGDKLKFYLHHVAMMKSRADRGLVGMWDTREFQVSHRCHNPLCVNVDHLVLESGDDNRERNTHCTGEVRCTVCSTSMPVCPHTVKCITVVWTVCSKCTAGAAGGAGTD